MSKSSVVRFSGREEVADALTDLLCRGAQAFIQQVVEAELSEFSGRFRERRLEDGRAVTFHWALVPPYVRKTRSLDGPCRGCT